MKLILLEALHARPANLFVRVASRYVGAIEVRHCDRRADAKNILEVLTLAAAKGAAIEISASGEDAEAALAALAALIERNFDTDLVPETGAAATPGIAVGKAVVFTRAKAAPDGAVGVTDLKRVRAAFVRVRCDLEEMVRGLPPADAALFEPEIAIVGALETRVQSRLARGETLEQALDDEVPQGRTRAPGTMPSSDLLLDARDRLLDAYAGDQATHLAVRLAEVPDDDDVVIVAEELTPSVVAAVPRRVVGIVAALTQSESGIQGLGYTSHAAILARGRGIPLMYVTPEVAHSVAQGDVLVLDTRATPPSLWLSPSEARIAAAKVARSEHLRRDLEQESEMAAPLTHLSAWGGYPFAVRVNIGSIHDRVPATSEGVGLVRTELFFAGRSRPPSTEEVLAVLLLVAGKVGTGPVVARLFDAGADKPLAWLPPTPDAPDARGIDLLQRHPDVLKSQIAAVARAATRADVRLLIPFVRHAEDVYLVRSLAPSNLWVGAMIESPEAAAATPAIALAADFVCIGTNDLTAAIRGEDRATAKAAPFDPRVLRMIAEVVHGAHGEGRVVTVCGEMAGDPEGAAILAGLGVDAVSVAPSRFAGVKSALAATTAAACREAARKALGD